MDYLEDILLSIKPLLKEYGFKKKGYNWIKEQNECIKIFNIQKSQFGKQVYLNIGFIIKKVMKDDHILMYKCPIQIRLDELIGKKYLDFENDIISSERCEAFKALIKKNPYSFITMNGSREDLNKFVKDSNTQFVTGEAKKYLGENA